MNILLLTQFFSTTRGGGEYVFSIIAKKLAENDHQIFVITNKILEEVYLDHKNIQVIFVPPVLEYKGGLPPGFLDNIRYTINAIRKGQKLIKKEKIDIIHSNNFAPALAGSILSRITSKPHITTVHDVFSLCGKNYWKKWGAQSDVSKINVWLAPFFEKLMIKLRHDCIHTVSESSRDDLLKFGAKKPIYVIHNSIETNTENKVTAPNTFQFVYVGRLVFYKNLEVAIKAIEIVKKTEPRVRLVVLGSGPHRNSLEDLVKKFGVESNIEFMGYVSSEEKSRIIAESNALVFPSLCEGFGLVILESFDKSRPVLVSNTRPMSDIVTNQKNGFVIDPYDENQWAECMLDLIKNPQKAIEMGKNGNDLLTKSYNQDKMYQNLLGMYFDVIENKTRM